MRLLVFVVGFAVAGFCVPSVADEPEPPAYRALVNDQQTVGQALKRLDARFQQVAEQLQAQRPEEARKLTAAWQVLKQALVHEDVESCLRFLQSGQALEALGKQEEIVVDIEGVLKALISGQEQQTATPEEITRALDQLAGQRQQVQELRDRERQALESTKARRQLAHAAEQLQGLEQSLAALAQAQERVRDQPADESSRSAEEGAKQLAGIAQAAGQLLEKQRQLSEAVASAHSDFEAAAAARQALAEAQRAMARPAETGKPTPASEASEHVAQALAAMAESESPVAKLATKQLGEALKELSESKAAGAEPTSSPEASSPSLSSGEEVPPTRADTERNLAQAAMSLEQEANSALGQLRAAMQQAQQGEKALAAQAQEAAAALEPFAAREHGLPEQERKAEAAKGAMSKASSAMSQAAEAAAAKNPQATGAAQREAERELERAVDQLKGKADLLAREKASDAGAADQRDLAAQAAAAAAALSAAGEAMQQAGKSEAGNATEAAKQAEAAGEAMQKASKSLAEGDQAGAKKEQNAAIEQLKAAQEGVAAERKRVSERLAKAELEERARKERERANQADQASAQLGQAGSQAQQQAGQKAGEAAGAMRKAAAALDQGQEGEAEAEQESAVEKLDEADEQLAQEQRAYEDLRLEAERISITAELQRTIDAQVKINKAVVELDNKRVEAGALSRRDRFVAKKLSNEELELVGGLTKLVDKLGEEQQVWVFSHRLEGVRVDAQQVAEYLADNPPDTGYMTQELARDIVRVLLELKEAFEVPVEQGEPTDEDGKKKPNEPSPPQVKRLVPPLAELNLLKTMQEELLSRTRDLNDAIALAGGEPNAFQRALLRRLAVQQGNLAGVLKKMDEDAKRMSSGH